jgi:hypothetical protein
MSIPAAWPQVLDCFGAPLVLVPSPGQLTSDAGLLPIRPFDEPSGLTRALADALPAPSGAHPRDPERAEHPFQRMRDEG